MKIKTKNTRYVYHKFGIKERFNVEHTKEKILIKVMKVQSDESTWR